MFLVGFAAIGSLLAATILVLAEQTGQLVQQVPGHLEQAKDSNNDSNKHSTDRNPAS